jgi:hypothetical protein
MARRTNDPRPPDHTDIAKDVARDPDRDSAACLLKLRVAFLLRDRSGMYLWCRLRTRVGKVIAIRR